VPDRPQIPFEAIPILASLTPEDRAALSPLCELSAFEKGAAVGRRSDGEIFLPLPLSRQDIADLVGTTIETAIRIMSRWLKEGIVDTEKTGFRILDEKALREIAPPAL
jgi:CRP-like cAMP-binding protein